MNWLRMKVYNWETNGSWISFILHVPSATASASRMNFEHLRTLRISWTKQILRLSTMQGLQAPMAAWICLVYLEIAQQWQSLVNHNLKCISSGSQSDQLSVNSKTHKNFLWERRFELVTSGVALFWTHGTHNLTSLLGGTADFSGKKNIFTYHMKQQRTLQTKSID